MQTQMQYTFTTHMHSNTFPYLLVPPFPLHMHSNITTKSADAASMLCP